MAVVYRRGRTWWVRFTRAGTEVRKSARTTVKATAERYLEQLLEEEGRLARGGRPRRTVHELFDRFRSEHLPTLKPRSAQRYETSMRILDPVLGGIELEQLERRHLGEFIAARRKERVSSPTIRRDLSCLGSALQLAISWDWVEANVVRTLDRRVLKEAPPRRRYLTHDEERRLLQAAPSYMRPLLVFAIETGVRREEQFGLTWERVDLVRREIRLEDTKAGVPRIVPLTDRALDVLKELGPRTRRSFVFVSPRTGTRYNQVARGLHAAAERAGILELRWHDLRRTCACRLVQDHGVDLFRVARWLGHTSTQMTERVYAHLRVEDLHAAVRPAQNPAHPRDPPISSP